MSQIKHRITLYDVPPDWAEFLRREAQKRGVSLSDFIKIYLIEPYVKKQKVEVVEA